MSETVKIRRFSNKGSEQVLVPVSEAEEQVEELVKSGYLVIDEDSHKRVTTLGDSRSILIVNPVAGG